jgi:hypothetical protein
LTRRVDGQASDNPKPLLPFSFPECGHSTFEFTGLARLYAQDPVK